MSGRALGRLMVALAAAAPWALAQSGGGAEGAPAGTAGLAEGARVDVDRTLSWSGQVGFEGPLAATAGFRLLRGLGADVREPDGRARVVCAAPLARCGGGFLVEAAAGSGGARLSLGLGARARVEDQDFRGSFGAALKTSLVRTWARPVGTRPGLTYLGPELEVEIARVDLTVGVLWRAAGHGGGSTIFRWGLGFRP